jgi:hypothetical protein
MPRRSPCWTTPFALFIGISSRPPNGANCAHFVLNSNSLQLTQAYSSQSRFFRSSWLDLA